MLCNHCGHPRNYHEPNGTCVAVLAHGGSCDCSNFVPPGDADEYGKEQRNIVAAIHSRSNELDEMLAGMSLSEKKELVKKLAGTVEVFNPVDAAAPADSECLVLLESMPPRPASEPPVQTDFKCPGDFYLVYGEHPATGHKTWFDAMYDFGTNKWWADGHRIQIESWRNLPPKP